MNQGWNRDGFDDYDESDGLEEDGVPYRSRKVWELSRLEREQIIQAYGNQPDSEGSLIQSSRPVQEVRTLTAWERSVFDKQSMVSAQCCTQILYKVRGEIERKQLQQVAQQLLAQNEELRVQFFPLGEDAEIHKLVFRKMTPDIRYRNMENIANDSVDRFLKNFMEDEQEKGFDLERASLVRFYLLKTPGRTSAVILTQSRMLAGRWNAHRVFASALEMGIVGRKMPNVWTEPSLEIPPAVSAYWCALFKNHPAPPDLPGYLGSQRRYKKKTHRVGLSEELMALLMEKSNGNKNLMIVILQTAWGLLQQQLNFRKDTYYCLILPDAAANAENATFTSHILHSLPMRLVCTEQEAIKDIVSKQFRQMVTSQSFRCSCMKEILSSLGNVEDMFSFILNFQNFFMNSTDYSEAPSAADGQVVAVSSWDAEKSNFTIYFSMENGQVRLAYVSNVYSFETNSIEHLARNYEVSLRNLLELWEHKQLIYARKMQQVLNGERGNRMEKHVRVQDYMNMISMMPNIRSIPKGCVKKLAFAAELKVLFMNEEISENDQKGYLIFLIRGKIEHRMDVGGEGPLTAVTETPRWLNESIFLPGPKYTEGMKVLSDQAHFLLVSLSTVQTDKELYPHMLFYALRCAWAYRQKALYS